SRGDEAHRGDAPLAARAGRDGEEGVHHAAGGDRTRAGDRGGQRRQGRHGGDQPRQGAAPRGHGRAQAGRAPPPDRGARGRGGEIREIWSETGVLPRAPGSAIFTRGQTQALTVVTLGTPSEEQLLDGLGIEESKRYLHHYNFPPFSVGEVRRLRGPSRRDIG